MHEIRVRCRTARDLMVILSMGKRYTTSVCFAPLIFYLSGTPSMCDSVRKKTLQAVPS